MKKQNIIENVVKESVTIQETVDFLNELLKIDGQAINTLFSIRMACNESLSDHDTVQVGVIQPNYFQVGMIGILNGLFGKDEFGWGHICADYYDGKIISFKMLTIDEVKKHIEK